MWGKQANNSSKAKTNKQKCISLSFVSNLINLTDPTSFKNWNKVKQI